MVRMKQRCQETVWWPGIDQNIEEMVRACVACVRSGKPLQPKPVPLHPIPRPTKPWEKIQIDVVGEFTRSTEQLPISNCGTRFEFKMARDLSH